MGQRAICGFILILGLTASSASARTWTSVSGDYKVEAELVEVRAEGVVILRTADGKLMKAKTDRLSQADQEFIQQQAPHLPKKNSSSAPVPAAEPEKAQPQKAPLPDEKAQTKARASIKEVFAVKKPPKELATELLKLAKDTTNDPTACYVLLLEAANAASRAGDGALLVEAVDELATRYEGVDATEKKTKLFENAAKTAALVDSGALALELLDFEDEVRAADDYNTGKRLLDAVIVVARKRRDGALLKQATGRQLELRDLQGEFQKAAKSIVKLKTQPTDSAANVIAGRYYALVKGDWEKGLPLLARGSDENLKVAAALDQSQPSEPAKQLEVADKWWDLSENARGSAKAQLRARGAFWYERAWPALGDESAKTKARSRLQEAHQEASERLVSGRITGKNADLQILLGTWQIRLPGNESATWEFKRDGRVTSTRGASAGSWQLEGGRVMIRWDQDPQRMWATLVRPLNPAGIVGDNSSATLAVRGKKTQENNQPRVALPPRQQDLGVMLGRWQVKAADGYTALWDFHPDGRVTSNNNAPEGRWQLEDQRVMIRWDRDPQKMWDTFVRPLNPAGIVGDNWTGELALRGQKINP